MINHGNICDFSFYVRAFDTKEHYRNYGQPATELSLQQAMSEFEKRCADNPVHVNTVLGVNFTLRGSAAVRRSGRNRRRYRRRSTFCFGLRLSREAQSVRDDLIPCSRISVLREWERRTLCSA